MAIFKGSGVAIVTPFHEDESINYDMLDQLIDYQCENGLTVSLSAVPPESQPHCLRKSIWNV